MTRHQIIASTTALLASLSVAAPVVAQANSLLSGYGGPGQGNQAILGSALLNGPRGGGGSGNGGSAGGSSSGLAESSSQEAVSTGAGRGPAEGARAAGSKHGSIAGGGDGRVARGGVGIKNGRQGRAGKASDGTAGTYPASERGEAARLAETLGLSVRDLVYILLALGVLVVTGVLTRRLTAFMATRTHV